MSVTSSSETVTNSNSSPRARNSFSMLTRSGNSSRQGSHQVAQKLTSRMRPFAALASSSVFSPTSFISLTSGPWAGLAAGFRPARRALPLPACGPAAAVVPAPAKASAAQSTKAFVKALPMKGSWVSAALDGAAEGFDLRLLDGLTGEYRLDGVAQLGRGDGVAVARVVDAAVVDELARGIEQVRLGRDLRVEAVGDDVA